MGSSTLPNDANPGAGTNAGTGPAQGGVALITGAARRIGAEVARRWHRAGGRVAITYRSSADDANALLAELNGQRPASAIAIANDIVQTAALPAVVDEVVGAFGRLDLLLNNASTFYPTPMGEIDEANWDDLIGTNLKGPMFLTQAAVPHLRRSRGLIINMLDIHARRPLAHHYVYCAAKAGFAMFTMSLARGLGPDVRVNGIAPGPILWPDHEQDDALKARIVANTALKRTGDPSDIASLVLYLAREGTYVTGQIIAVDGGRSVGW
jgi:pteridine reductase